MCEKSAETASLAKTSKPPTEVLRAPRLAPWVGKAHKSFIASSPQHGGSLLSNLKAELSGECGHAGLAQTWGEAKGPEGRREWWRLMGPARSQKLGATRAGGEEDGLLSKIGRAHV